MLKHTLYMQLQLLKENNIRTNFQVNRENFQRWTSLQYQYLLESQRSLCWPSGFFCGAEREK